MRSTQQKASVIVNSILWNLRGRKGVGDELESYDETISKEIADDLIDVVDTHLRVWQNEEQPND